ncbi:glutamine-hydrolyzing carbamoyl-phosphate synthase small subunit [Haloimpatiens lingqiaonensis]|uniref:glutamine-hydrolyzing carbamoyl-phosphate synthase small subunit n=1 Tax=Haloimpatiens lingqiaonensis TaxID=1380675 RepID=UPI0010FD8AE2|nr:glutamine-hydrolyzing carbamoyl-phosphate synthase small subunit [Haloimpatiens lingqiaonensis]
MKANLILENGVVFSGEAFGYLEEAVGEVVFNTGMTGYQEVLTDPSYWGQIVTMTYPLIGNYGVNLEDLESKSPKVKGFIVKEYCKNPSNFRAEMNLDSYLKQNKIIGLENIDTRALTKVLRNSGTMRGVIALGEMNKEAVQEKIKSFSNVDAVKKVTAKEKYTVDGSGKHVALMDFGVKENIIRCFKERNCKITVLPAYTKPEEMLNLNPDLIFLSNGPGDPEDLPEIIENIKALVGKKPIGGICLGHQLLALALGGSTEKLKFGHRGCNHPVKDLERNRVYITSQNHGYVVKEMPENMVVTHVSLNDGSIEGMRSIKQRIFSVQYHPEASPGPIENQYLFDEFLNL